LAPPTHRLGGPRVRSSHTICKGPDPIFQSIGVGGSLTGLFQIFTSRQGKKDTNTKDTMTKSITRRIAIAIVAVRSIRGLYA